MPTAPELFNAHLDGKQLSSAELKQLTSWINSDRNNAVTAVELAFIHEQIDTNLTIPRLLEEMSSTADPAVRRAIELAIRAVEEQQPRQLVEPAPASHSRAPRAPRYRLVAALASSVLVAATCWGIFAGRTTTPERTHLGDPLAKPGEQSPAPPPAADEVPVVAMISESLDAEWDHPGRVHRGRQIRAGEQLTLLSGILQLTTTQGCDVVLQAPVTATLENAGKIRLLQGKLAARIQGQGSGLTVETPAAEVVDLGTEFGVAVSESGDTRLAVYEGLVRLSSRATTTSEPPATREISAGRSGSVDAQGKLDWTITMLAHDREFVRPDEVAARRSARLGSDEAREQTSFYRLQRISGLVAYQGFDIPSDGEQLTLAFDQLRVPQQGMPNFVRNLRRERPHASGALSVAAQSPVFLGLDTSSNSPLAQAGLLDERGLVGRSGTEIWLSWTSRSTNPGRSGDYAGVSLMFGDERLMQEPIFAGTLDAENQLSLVANVGSRPIPQNLDENLDTPAVEPMRPSDQPQLWVMRASFGERADKVAVWCGVPLEEISSTRPQATVSNANVIFDRLRLDVGRSGAAWEFDDFFISTNLEAIAAGSRLLELE